MKQIITIADRYGNAREVQTVANAELARTICAARNRHEIEASRKAGTDTPSHSWGYHPENQATTITETQESLL